MPTWLLSLPSSPWLRGSGFLGIARMSPILWALLTALIWCGPKWARTRVTPRRRRCGVGRSPAVVNCTKNADGTCSKGLRCCSMDRRPLKTKGQVASSIAWKALSSIVACCMVLIAAAPIFAIVVGALQPPTDPYSLRESVDPSAVASTRTDVVAPPAS